jgi:hypothetical protein
MLPEDLAARGRELDERAFGALTGRSESTKAAYVRWLAPYARAPLGGVALIVRHTTLRDEESRLRLWIERRMGAQRRDLDGLDDVVRMAVERRSIRAQRLLQWALRGWLAPHVLAVAVTLVLLVAHAMSVWVTR